MAVGAREVRFGRYRLVERIGAGGMAEVHRAVAEGPGGFARTVVIKRMLPQLSGDDAFARMLLAEGRLTALLQHPGIVQVYEVGAVDGIYYLAMEHVDGVDLASLMRAARERLRIPPPVACAIAVELAGALAYAHARTDERGQPCAIVHRDVSPANVMVTPLGAVKLLDFGIAKAADSLRDVETRTGTLKGKAAYMSPEQAEGDAVDGRSDQFALGVVLHEMLTLERLFRGSDDLETLKRVRAAVVPTPSVLVSGLDGELERVVMKMLSRRADERFASCDDVVAALAPIARRLGGDAAAVRAYLAALGPMARASRPRVAARETKTFDLGPRVAASAPAKQRGRIAYGVVALLLLIGVVAVALRHHGASAAPANAAPVASAAPTALPPPPVTAMATTPAVATPSTAPPRLAPPPRRAHASRPRHDERTAPPAHAHDLYDPFARP